MNHRANATIAILIVLIAISLILAGGVFYFLQKERVKTSELQVQLEDINTRLKSTENNLDDSRKKITDLSTKLQDAQAKIDTLNSELKEEKASREEALAKIEILRVDLDRQKELRADLEDKLNKAQDEARNTQNQLNQLDSEKQELQIKVKDLEAKTQSIELGNVVVSPEPAVKATKTKKQNITKAPATKKVQPPKILEGKVLVVNKDYDFVVVNLGGKDGVRAGQIFSVYHGTKYLGDVKVEKVHDSMAAANFSVSLKEKISEGDKVVQKVK